MGVEIVLEGDRLRIRAPKDALTPEIEAELRRRRDELYAFLEKAKRSSDPHSGLIPLRATGTRPPLFMIPGHNGDVFAFLPLMKALSEDQPLFAFQPPGLDASEESLCRVEDLAARFIVELRRTQPDGPYRIGGYCTGGMVAYEAARQLLAQGEDIDALVLCGTSSPPSYRTAHQLITPMVRAINRSVRFLREALQRKTQHHPTREDAGLVPNKYRDQLEAATNAAVRRYTLDGYPGRIDLFIPSGNPAAAFCEKYFDWRHYCNELEVHKGPAGCIHSKMLREPYVRSVAVRLEEILANPGTTHAQAAVPSVSLSR
jgi:thioesterase domain-containing protein